MTMSEAQAWVLIIAAVGGIVITVVGTVMTAIITYMSREKLGDIKASQSINQAINTTKLDTIHNSTNGGLSALQQQLDAAATEISNLKGAIATLRRTHDGGSDT